MCSDISIKCILAANFRCETSPRKAIVAFTHPLQGGWGLKVHTVVNRSPLPSSSPRLCPQACVVLTHPETSTLQPSPYPTFNPVFNSSSSTIPGRCSAGQWPDGLCSTAGTRRVYRWGGEEEGKPSHHITRQPRSYLDISVLPHCPFIPALTLCGTPSGCFGCQWFEGQPLG